MQDLWDSVVGKHGQMLYSWSGRPWKYWVTDSWQGEEGCPSFRNEDLRSFPDVYCKFYTLLILFFGH